jgi:hypothetical protein
LSTFLELVNTAIQEAGKDQDDLQSVDFVNPPDPRMYNRFKRWVQQSYKEVQMAREEWEFKTSRASLFVLPAIYVEQGSRTVAPPVGTYLRGNDTDYAIEVRQVVLHTGTWAGGTAKATIYYTVPDFNEGIDFKFNEVFDEIDANGNVLDAAVWRSKGWGRFDFVADGQLTDLLEPFKLEFKIQSTGGSSIQDNEADVGLTPLVYVPWNDWNWTFDNYAAGRGKPQYITTAPDGAFELYPRPDKQYVLYFTYTKADGTMTAAADTPALLPARYHEILAWMAVRKSGMFDNDRYIVTRADEQITKYRNALEKNQMPDLTFGPSRYDRE